jgi:hypothetical protein
MDSSDAFGQIDRALEIASAALEEDDESFVRGDRGQRLSEAVTVCASTISRLTATGSVYERQAKRILDRQGQVPVYHIGQLVGVLHGLRRDIEAGYLQSFEEEIHADVFADFLEMADQLLRDGYVLPAAVVAGSALEAQLRALAERAGVPTHARGKPKRAGMLNDDLVKNEVYSKSQQKQVMAWQDLRNSAAHGEDDFTTPEIRLMIQGIRDFVARHPA